MAADNLGRKSQKPQVIEGESRVVQGPWETGPKSRPKPPPREPFFKRSKGASGRRREPMVNNWRNLILCLALLFLAPPLVGWISHLILSLFGGQ
jgi:hypothetical protein